MRRVLESRYCHPVAFATILIFLLLTTFTNPANAASYAGMVMDAKTGKVLYSHRGDARQYPASLTKMMTLYLVFEALESGSISKKTRIRFSKHAASMQPSKLGIKPGGSITAEQAILALVTKSANDVSAAVAEHIGGTESGFAVMMTGKARELGMDSTTFKNASGLPNSAQVTTARDMAILGIALREHFPQYYSYFSRRSFTYGKASMRNHNRLLGKVKGVDGIKTGYTRASGFNLVTSVAFGERSIVAVVLGGRTGKSRNAQMVKLINKYLPKASRGEDRIVVARPGGSTLATEELPEKGPIPSYRRGGIDSASIRVATAHVISASVTPPPSPLPGNVSLIEAKLRALASSKLPVSAPSPEDAIVDAMHTASVRPAKDIPYVMAYTPKDRHGRQASPAGWQVQISAVEEKSAAIEMLEAARSKFPSLLSAYDNYTETVEKGGVVLHRARFAGFESKSRAWDTCHQLKRNKIACLAIQN